MQGAEPFFSRIMHGLYLDTTKEDSGFELGHYHVLPAQYISSQSVPNQHDC